MRFYLISRPVLGNHVALMADRNTSWAPLGPSTDAEQLIELCGRVCYLSFKNPSGQTTRGYAEHLIRQGHESVLEHASWTFVLDDVSRGFTHQLVRHRVGVAFSQMSQQYVDQRSERFFSLPLPESSMEVARLIGEAFSKAREAYASLDGALSSIVNKNFPNMHPKERRRLTRTLARSVLPNGLSTTIAVTVNARAARHILRVRGTIEGDLEMREFSAHLYNMLVTEAPSVVADYRISDKNGLPILMQIGSAHASLDEAS